MENLATYSQEFTQQFFEFKDWRKAFEVWDEQYEFHRDNIQFVVSWNPYNSGYWIEKAGTELGNNASIYSNDKVHKLHKKVQSEITKAARDGRSAKFVR